jgi:hypothetical protein
MRLHASSTSFFVLHVQIYTKNQPNKVTVITPKDDFCQLER